MHVECNLNFVGSGRLSLLHSVVAEGLPKDISIKKLPEPRCSKQHARGGFPFQGFFFSDYQLYPDTAKIFFAVRCLIFLRFETNFLGIFDRPNVVVDCFVLRGPEL